MILGLFFFLILGLICGSFFNVCIYRLPREQSIVFPASHCPNCSIAIKSYDNIPLLSYLLLRGKCRHCQQTISGEYPLVELLTGLFFAGSYYYFWPLAPFPLEFIKALVFISLLIIISFIDLHFQIIPNRLSYPGIVLGLILGAGEYPGFAVTPWAANYLAGALVGGGILLLIALVYPGGTGFGDVKLTAMLGAFLGLQAVLVAIFSAYLLGAIISLSLIVLKLRSRKDAIPFGPFLSLGGILAFFWGDLIALWYIARF